MAGRLGILDAKGPVAVRGPTKTRPKKNNAMEDGPQG